MCFRGENVKNINIVVNICTYHRNDFVEHNISKLLQSKFFDLTDRDYYAPQNHFCDMYKCLQQYLYISQK